MHEPHKRTLLCQNPPPQAGHNQPIRIPILSPTLLPPKAAGGRACNLHDGAAGREPPAFINSCAQGGGDAPQSCAPAIPASAMGKRKVEPRGSKQQQRQKAPKKHKCARGLFFFVMLHRAGATHHVALATDQPPPVKDVLFPCASQGTATRVSRRNVTDADSADCTRTTARTRSRT